MIVAGVRNGDAEEDWLGDLNPGVAAIQRGPPSFGEEGRGPRGFGGIGGENHGALAEWGLPGGDTADGAGSLNCGLPLLFLRYGTPDWAEGEGGTVVHLWVFYRILVF